mgnify:CR=1 FL=1
MNAIPFLTAPLWFVLLWLCARSLHRDLTTHRAPSRSWRIIP